MADWLIITRDEESNSVKSNPLRESAAKDRWLSLINLEILKVVVQIEDAPIFSKPKGKAMERPKSMHQIKLIHLVKTLNM